MCRLVCEDRINELACVVVDELHMVQDRSRGSTVELMLTKLMHAAAGSRGDDAGSSPSRHDGDEDDYELCNGHYRCQHQEADLTEKRPLA